MLQHNLKKFVYQSSTEEKQSSQGSQDLNKQTIEKLLQSLANQSMREKAPSFEELESILQGNIDESNTEQTKTESNQSPKSDDTKPITKFLLERGYLKDDKNWITKMGCLDCVFNKINE